MLDGRKDAVWIISDKYAMPHINKRHVLPHECMTGPESPAQRVQNAIYVENGELSSQLYLTSHITFSSVPRELAHLLKSCLQNMEFTITLHIFVVL